MPGARWWSSRRMSPTPTDARSPRSSRPRRSCAQIDSPGDLARRADVDHQGEDRLHDWFARSGVLPVGLGDGELELAAVGSFLLVHVGDDARALEDVADLGPAFILEGLLPVEDGAAGGPEAVDGGPAGGPGAAGT